MKRFQKALIFLFFLLIQVACKDEPEKNSGTEKFYEVKTKEAVGVDYHEKIKTTGKVTFKNEYKLSFKTSGIIDNINVNEGDNVHSGQILASLKLDEIKAKVEQAENAVDKAERDYERARGLYADSVVTLEQLQNSQTQLSQARLDLEAARFNMRYSQIIAPGNGVVQKIDVTENEAIQAGTPVIVFGGTGSEKSFETYISDVDIVKISTGDTALLHFDPYPDREFTGRVSEIAGLADPSTGTYEVKIGVSDEENLLKSGFIGNAIIHSSINKKLVMVPVEALISADVHNGSVYIVRNGIAHVQEVKVDKMGDSLLISRGLNAGDNVIIEGLQNVSGDSIPVNSK